MLAAGELPLTTSIDHLKHCVMVKLTDTSYKILQEHLKNNDYRKPTLLFKDDKGELSIPVGNANDGYRKFQFSISSIKGFNRDATSSFDCISYSDSKLKSIGTIEQKITIQATDEVFQATKDKVNSVAEEEKKNSTKEIKPSANRLVRNKTVKHTLSADSGHSLTNRKQRTAAERPIRERIVHLLVLKPYSKAELTLRLNKDGLTDRDKESIDNILAQIGSINSKSNAYELHNNVILNEVSEDWYFYSDGEKQLVKRILKNAQNTKSTNAVQSRRSVGSNLMSSQDKSANDLKTRISPTSIDTTSKHRERTRDRDKELEKEKEKERLEREKDRERLESEKERAEQERLRMEKEKERTMRDRERAERDRERLERERERKELERKREEAERKQEKEAQMKNYENTDITRDKLLVKDLDSLNTEKALNSNVESKKEVKVKNPDVVDQAENQVDKLILKKFDEITSIEQWTEYETEFNQLHIEYESLHNYIESIIKIFNKYKEDIRNLKPGTKDYNDLHERIIKFYDQIQHDEVYLYKHKRYNILREKLALIKSLCESYTDSR